MKENFIQALNELLEDAAIRLYNFFNNKKTKEKKDDV